VSRTVWTPLDGSEVKYAMSSATGDQAGHRPLTPGICAGVPPSAGMIQRPG